ncbi:MAG: sigma-54-dependent Fis family transcriptional regulator, partial [Cephaloticoccus sp.]|nr:sigma-54-dependent Fis family transcriptional regulator [Cephaloticoccus sp.]
IYRSAVVAQGDAILVKDLPAELGGSAISQSAAPFEAAASAPTAGDLTVESAYDFLAKTLAAADAPIIPAVSAALAQRVLAAVDGNETVAAKQLGVTKPALKKLLG